MAGLRLLRLAGQKILDNNYDLFYVKTMRPLLIILLSVGLLWLRSSFGKFTGGTFVNSLGATLTKTAEKNPYPWFKDFLTSVAIPNAQVFGLLVLWGEILSAVAITVGAIMLLMNSHPNKFVSLVLVAGLAGGALLNIVFWLGFGYTSPSTESLNLLMAVVQIIGIFFVMQQFAKG